MKLAKPVLGIIFLIGILTAIAQTSFAVEKHMKVIDFEDEVVEGMNKRPLDSLSYLSDPEKDRNRKRIYRKRIGFRTEIQETLRDLRYR